MAFNKYTECGKERSDRATAATAALENAKTGNDPIDVIKGYQPNWFVQFLGSRRFFSIIIIFICAIAASFDSGSWLVGPSVMLFGTLSFILIVLHFTYPMYQLKKYFRNHHIDDAIQNDTGYMNVAISAYNIKPGKKMLAYIRSLNLEAAQKIEQQLAARKKK